MKSKIIWFTGLSGSGKTTLSNYIFKKLKNKKFKVKKIDGDIFRKKNKVNKFTREGIIKNNLEIIKKISDIMLKYDYIIISVISPLKQTRKLAYNKFKENYFEVYTKCSIKKLIKRDPKKLYFKAKNNLIKDLIGFNSKIQYEETNYKKIIVNTGNNTIRQSADKIFKKI